MPPRDPSLPEGTDHIIDTNIDLGPDTGGGGSGGSSGGTGGIGGASSGSPGGGGSSGGIGGASSGSGGGVGAGSSSGTSGLGGGGSGQAGGSGGTGGSAFQFDKKEGGDAGSKSSGIMGQVKDQISTLKSQAGERARGIADDGKSKATDFLGKIAEIVADAAGSVEDRLGGQYAGYGNRASDQIRTLASSLDERSIDDLLEDARAFVQRSPAAAIGIAAILGFAVARVMRASIIEYRADGAGTGGDVVPTTGGTGGSGGMGAGATGGLNATSGAFGETGVGTAGNVGGAGTSTGAGSTGGTGNAPTI